MISLTGPDTRERTGAIRDFALLQREQSPADLAALEDLLLSVSWLIEECPEISALELQPISVRTAAQAIKPPFGMISGLTPKNLGSHKTRSANLPTSIEPT